MVYMLTLMLTKLGYIHGQCYHDHSIHTWKMDFFSEVSHPELGSEPGDEAIRGRPIA